MAITRRRAEGTCTRSVSGGPQRQRRMAKPNYFASRCKGALAPAENSWAQPLPVPTGCRPIALLKAGRGPVRPWTSPDRPRRNRTAALTSFRPSPRARNEQRPLARAGCARLTLSRALDLFRLSSGSRESAFARGLHGGRIIPSRSLRKRAALMRRVPSPFLSLQLDSDPAGINCECAPMQRRHFTRQTFSSRQSEIVSIERVPPRLP
jgi:hypothetical protein